MIQPTQESEEKTKVAEILDNRKKKKQFQCTRYL